jgi:biopolymer transport protein ExbB/TolQ
VRRYTPIFVCSGLVMILGLITIALGQNAGSESTMEERVRQLEQKVASLDTLLQLRTNFSGTQGGSSRDLNVAARFGQIERRVQQMESQSADFRRQVSSAVRAASQAQSDARMAQQTARDAAARIR